MRRRMLASLGGAKLPYKRRLAYIESTGTQWIDTGYLSADNTTMKCRFMVVSKMEFSYGCVFGAQRDAMAGVGFAIAYRLGRVYLYRSTGRNYFSLSMGNVHVGEINIESCSLDGITGQYGSLSSPVGLGIRIFSTSSGLICNARFYEGTISGSDEDHLIPVIDNNGVACVYGETSGRFFYNQGEGEFLYGEIE